MKRIQRYLALIILAYCYGVMSLRYELFPAPQLRFIVTQASLAVTEFSDKNEWYYIESNGRKQIPIYKKESVQEGLTLITGLTSERTPSVKVINFQGDIIHKWDIDWYKIWPDSNHIPKHLIPKGKPGTHIHGSKLTNNGGVLFNFENLGFVNLDACGNTLFKVPYPTHHAIEEDDNGDYWLPGQIYYQEALPQYPNYIPPFKDDTIVKISKQGKVLFEISIMDLLKKNGYSGLMYLSTIKSRNTQVSGDIYHLNDVELFPNSMDEGTFKHGDVMVSLRNINTVFIFDPKTLKIRYLTTGKFVRQHDPDFIDGNHFSVLDNNHIAPNEFGHSSKIVIVSAHDDQVKSYFSATDKVPFYTNIMGKHQWLPNGNLLILEAMNGRVIEVNAKKEIVWSYNNLIADGKLISIMEGAHRLPLKFDLNFFKQAISRCEIKN
jgi:hypothetical protein